MTLGQRTSQAVQAVAEGSGFAWGFVCRAFTWVFAPLCDDWSGLSLNRFIAIVFAAAAVHGRLFHDVPITGPDVLLATLAGALSFGKDTFLAWVNRRHDDSATG